jgi:hypothetical protein
MKLLTKLFLTTALLLAPPAEARITNAPAGAGQYPGVPTGTPAAAGNIGELITASCTATSNTSTVATNCAQVSLTPGDWDCSGALSFNTIAAQNYTSVFAWISQTSASTPSPPNAGSYALLQLPFSTTGVAGLQTGPVQELLSSTTTVYLSGQANYSGGAGTFTGFLRCRRTH